MALLIRAILGILTIATGVVIASLAFSGKLFSRSNNKNGEFMGYRKKYSDDDFESRKLKIARERFDRELKSVRNWERDKRQKFNRIDGAWRLVSVGAGLMVGGFLVDTNAPAAVGLGILVGGAVGWIGAIINNFINKIDKTPEVLMEVPKRVEFEPPKVQANGIQAGKTEFATKVIEEGHANLKALEVAMAGLRHPQSISTVANIISIGRKLISEIAENPENANSVQRLFTYYAMEASKVVEGLGKIEGEKKPDIERIIATQTILQKILLLFESTQIELRQDENKLLDIDLKLLDQSLQSDLRTK